MKRITMLLAILLSTACAGRALCAGAPAALVKKLSSGSYAEREKAGRMLEQLGAAALPALRDGMENADLETRRRAVLLMERIEDRVAVEELVQPTRIGFKIKEMPIDDAIRHAAEKMGLRLGFAPHKRRLKIDADSLPYWQAWRGFRAAAGLHESDYADSTAKLKRVDADAVRQLMEMLGRHDFEIRPKFLMPPIGFAANPAPGAYAEDDRSSVRVRVRWLSLDKSLDGKTPHAVFVVEVRPEPRLEITALPAVQIDKIIDADGKETTVEAAKLYPAPSDPREAAFLAAYLGEIQYGGLLHLKAIPWDAPVRPLKAIHGRVRLESVCRARLLEVPGVLKAQGKQVRGPDGVTLKVLEADVSDEGELTLRLRFDHLESLAPQSDEEKIVRARPGVIAIRGAMDVALERLQLRDQRGWPHRPGKTDYRQMEDGSYEATVAFAEPHGGFENVSLLLTKAPRTVSLEVPFHVSDVAAPQ